ncbi:hypothetical protein OOK36_55110 [Streptomyces sp. NBC_00365]|uniref:hypothetical protein n=1 Tax=Streptomyces sp. NBC_00365 TaxID=2975726 RepID=UPI0022563E28|nr:hypothetical protein [Streptomyces sp. NBC_00365]MCX5097586.1 hypothetical protein [Streptomyces sp. NBC_00365]
MSIPWGDIATFSTAGLSAVATAGAWLAAHRSAKTAETLTRIERDRRREERRPQLELTLGGGAQAHSTLDIHLAGPDELGEVEFLSVRVDDDDKDRSHVLGIGATAEQLTNHVWGPFRFTPRVDQADEHGRTMGPFKLRVGRGRRFQMDRTQPGQWMDGKTMEQWQDEYRDHPVRLVITCRTNGDEWTLARQLPNEAY